MQKMEKVLIIANARRDGGLSGGDNIYLNIHKYFPCETMIWDMLNINFKPFTLCYIYRIAVACFTALFWKIDFDTVYSASDFWMDSLPALILKLRGCKWIAGFYLFAPKENRNYYYTQKVAYRIIKWFADIVYITNNSYKDRFADKKTIDIHGGVDISKCDYKPEAPRIYDAVFIGRIHATKGIDDLIQAWKYVRAKDAKATLAIIGDGDLGIEYIRKRLPDNKFGVTYFGFMGDDRFAIYKSSRCVIYPTRTHFSMSPVEAMACGCPMITYHSVVMNELDPRGVIYCTKTSEIAEAIIWNSHRQAWHEGAARKWAAGWDWKPRIMSIYFKTKGMIE